MNNSPTGKEQDTFSFGENESQENEVDGKKQENCKTIKKRQEKGDHQRTKGGKNKCYGENIWKKGKN